MTASDVMDGSRAALNDIPGDVYSDETLLPYLKQAWAALQSEMQNNDIPTLFETTAVLTVPASTTLIGVGTTPALPDDLIEISDVFERANSSERFIEVDKRDWLPNDVPTNRLRYWAWREEEIQLIGATTPREVQIRYVKSLPTITGGATNLPVRGAKLYLEFKTAALAAEFIGSNRTRADRLESMAQEERDKFINSRVKSKQNIVYKRLVRRSRW